VVRTDNATHYTLTEGWALLTDIPWQEDNTLRILVVYAPDHPQDNQSFWEELADILEQNPSLNLDVILRLDGAPGHSDDGGAVEALQALKGQMGVADGGEGPTQTGGDSHTSTRQTAHNHE
jgi:hypothetical protein